MTINIQQLSCVSKQWNIENLSPLSQSKRKTLTFDELSNVQQFSLDSIRYGENLSLLFKCSHRKSPDEKLEMKHISLSHDPSLAKKYVRSIFLRTVSLWNFSSQIDVSHNPIGDFFRHFISNVDSSKSTHRQKPSSHHLAVPSLSLILLWQISLSNQLGQMEVRHGLHMISPKVELPNNEPETNNTIHYELIYSAMVEHAFPKCLFLPVQLKIFNRMNEQVHLHLQLLRYSELVFIAINRLIFLRLDQHWMQIHCCPHVVSGQE